jgi:hypothetical protein
MYGSALVNGHSTPQTSRPHSLVTELLLIPFKFYFYGYLLPKGCNIQYGLEW